MVSCKFSLKPIHWLVRFLAHWSCPHSWPTIFFCPRTSSCACFKCGQAIGSPPSRWGPIRLPCFDLKLWVGIHWIAIFQLDHISWWLGTYIHWIFGNPGGFPLDSSCGLRCGRQALLHPWLRTVTTGSFASESSHSTRGGPVPVRPVPVQPNYYSWEA